MSSSFIANASVSPIFAKRRLVKDWKELQQEQENLLTVSALPTSDIYKWRACLKPDNGPYAGTVFHLELQFDDSYPRDPPKIKLFTTIAHPNVFDSWNGHNDIYICLDMLEPYTSKKPYEGWSAAYSVTSVLLQLQSFLFAESIPQDYGGSMRSYRVTDPRVTRAIQKARDFTCRIVTSDGETVVHTHSDPWPPLPKKKVAITTPMTVDMQSYAPPEIPIAVWRDSIFGFLGPKDIITARNVCSYWRKIVVSYNLFERSQLSCFYSKKTLNDKGCILGVGIVVEYHRNCSGLKAVTSPLDLLSTETFRTEGVCTSVFDKQEFRHLLPLVLNKAHASKARREMETTICDIMKSIPAPSWSGIYGRMPPFERLYPYMILQLMASLMNSMVVQLMNDANEGTEIRRHASEKALEGYCAFHHMLLYFGSIYPSIVTMANKQVDDFVAHENNRFKTQTPDLGSLLVCLTLSNKGWQTLWKPFLLEMFDRNVRWLLRKYPQLASTCSDYERLTKTFDGTKTSLRLLMFQVYFMSQIGRPVGSTGPEDILSSYDRRLGRPTTGQQEDLQQECKHILAVNNWVEFFKRCKVPVPPTVKLTEMLRQAISNSFRKGYHQVESGRDPTSGQQRQQGSGGGRNNFRGGRGRGRGGRGPQPRRY